MNMYFDIIKPLIDACGKPDAEIERDIGLPAHTIHKWNTGKYKSYKDYLPQIAEYFNVTLNYLYGIKETEDELDLTKWEKDFILLIRTLPPDVQEKIYSLAQSVSPAQQETDHGEKP